MFSRHQSKSYLSIKEPIDSQNESWYYSVESWARKSPKARWQYLLAPATLILAQTYSGLYFWPPRSSNSLFSWFWQIDWCILEVTDCSHFALTWSLEDALGHWFHLTFTLWEYCWDSWYCWEVSLFRRWMFRWKLPGKWT